MMRDQVERRSAVFVVFLRSLPKPVPGLVVLALVALGLRGPVALGVAALLLVALLLGWLLYLSWPRLPGAGRAIRLVVIAIVLAGTVSRVAG